ncbi:hypothetical protein [Streptomyces sp. SM10]|uniref:hypothetical protein n=1 Tax=Streptomyces sp. SM10 TaxID=565556 RepID=UPI000CD5C952|nr:hypothetical protein [Streptomyces sp. SM10]
MPSYHEVMTTDLSTLITAAEKWDAMAGRFATAERSYRRDVHGISLGPSWVGQSAESANRRFDITLKEYAAAQAEAKALASLIRDAHAQFVDLRGKVKTAAGDAVAAGMTVSDRGQCHLDFSKLTEDQRFSARHDPDLHSTEQSWTDRISRAVQAVGDADAGFALALKAATRDSNDQDGTQGGFNHTPSGDIEVYEAEAVADTAMKLNAGEKVSPTELDQFERVIHANSGNKDFSQPLLARLGADGTIKLGNRLFEMADGDKKSRAQLLGIQRELGNSIASATKDPQGAKERAFYEDFTEDLRVNGTGNYGEAENPIRGYSGFVAVMNMADEKFDPEFMYELGDELIAAEGKDKELFVQLGVGHNGVRADAIDNLLGIMSRDPDTATAYLDPGPDPAKGNGRLDYLMGQGENAREWPKVTLSLYPLVQTDDPFGHAGLGAALEAATTGHIPLQDGEDPWPDVKHTEAQARILHTAVTDLAPTSGTEAEIPANLRRPLANALGEYGSDTHQILTGVDTAYMRAANGDGYFEQDGSTHLAVHADDLSQVLRGLSEDPEAFGTLEKAELRHIGNVLGSLPEGTTPEAVNAKMENMGTAMGAYSAIKEDVLNDERMDKYADADWKMKAAYHLVGGAVTPLYFTAGGAAVSIAYGDLLQRGVDTITWELGNSMKGDADAVANAAISDRYLATNEKIAYMVEGWAQDRPGVDNDAQQAYATYMLQGHDRGVGTTSKYLTDGNS